jgi:predicted Zn-dependent protease
MRTPLALLAASAVAIAPASAQVAQPQYQQPLTYLNSRDVQEAARQHPEIVAEFGGAETGSRAAYVEGVGRRVAAYSGPPSWPSLPFYDAQQRGGNAFAVPGGYVYLTRQLMGIINDEAELAFVVGHETGHIAANHHQRRRSAATNNSILGVLGAILGSAVGGQAFGGLLSQYAQQFSKMRLLSFSRDQEYQADVLGIRYLAAAGYDPNASATMLNQLTRSAALEARLQATAPFDSQNGRAPTAERKSHDPGEPDSQTGRAGQGLRNRDVPRAARRGNGRR